MFWTADVLLFCCRLCLCLGRGGPFRFRCFTDVPSSSSCFAIAAAFAFIVAHPPTFHRLPFWSVFWQEDKPWSIWPPSRGGEGREVRREDEPGGGKDVGEWTKGAEDAP
jgi:hypothetical protein